MHYMVKNAVHACRVAVHTSLRSAAYELVSTVAEQLKEWALTEVQGETQITVSPTLASSLEAQIDATTSGPLTTDTNSAGRQAHDWNDRQGTWSSPHLG